MATSIDMPIPSNYNPTGINPGDPNNEIARLRNLQSFVPGSVNSQVKVLGLNNTPSPFVPSVSNPSGPILPSRMIPTDGGGGSDRDNGAGWGRTLPSNKYTGNIIVPLNPQGNGSLGVAGAGGYAPGMSKPGVPVATGRDYGVPVTVQALSGKTGSGDPRLRGAQYWRDLGIDPNATEGSADWPLKWVRGGGSANNMPTGNAILPGESLGIPTNLAPNKNAPISITNMSPTARAVLGMGANPSSTTPDPNVPLSGKKQAPTPSGAPAPNMGPTSIYGATTVNGTTYGYPTSSGTQSYTGPTVGGGLDPKLHDELVKTYGSGFGNTLWNTLSSGAGFNPGIANAFIREMQPIFQENLANAMEYFSGTGSRFSSAAALGAGKAVADFSAKQQAIFAQMYMWAYQNYLNVLQYGATNTGDNTFGNIRSILGLISTGGKALQGLDLGTTGNKIGDVLAGL